MSPLLVKALVKRSQRTEQVQANAPPASKEIIKQTTQPDGKVNEDKPASSSSHVDHIISQSAAALKITEGLSELAGIPALKVVTGALARFLELVDQMRKNKDDYIEFALSIYETIKGAKDELIRFQESLTDLENFVKVFGDLETELLKMVYDAERLMKQSFLQKVWSTSTTKDTLRKYQDRLNRKISIFMLRNTIVARAHVEILNAEESLFGDYSNVILGQMELLDQLQRGEVITVAAPHEQESEYSVKIGNEKKTARFYEGDDGIKRLKNELEVISRFRHPQLGQLFGVCKSNQHPALIFHQEMTSIEPYYKPYVKLLLVETMHFIYDCIQAFVKAREYLISQCEELRTIRSAGVLKEFLVNVKSGRYALGMNMRLAPDGRIIMMLSVADPLPKSIYNETSINLLEGRAWPIHKIYPPIGRSDTDIATFVAFNYRNRTENKLIQFQSILFSIGESYFSYIGRDDLKTIRGRRTVNWGGGIISYSNPLDFNPPIRIAPELVQQVGNSDILDFDIKGEWVRFAVPCSKSSSAVFEFTVKPDMRHLGNAWVSQMVYVYYLLGDKFKYLRYYGLPSVELLHPSYWTFSFQAEFINEKRRIVDVPSMIYLFVSFLTGAGGIVEPDWYWSWCGHGTERLSLRERLQVGIVGTPYLEASLKSERIVWPLSRLTAIECLHYSYGFRPNSRDAAKTLGLSIINLSSKERRRSQSVSADTARQTPGCRQRSYSESSRTNNEPTWLKRKKSAAENDYQAELRILHTYPSVSDDTIMVPNADFIFTKRGCHLPRIIKETRPFPMPKFFNS